MKTYYIVFNSDLATSIIVFSCLIMIAYSSIVMIFNKHIRSQITLFCLAIFCLLIISLALKNQSSFTSSFFYILSYNVCALSIFFFATFAWTRYGASSMDDLVIFKSSAKFLNRNSHILFLLAIILSAPLPYSPIFFANFFLFDAVLYNNDDQLYEFSNFFDPYILTAILLFHIGSLALFFKLTSSLINSKESSKESRNCKSKTDSAIFYIVNLLIAILLLSIIGNIKYFGFVAEKFSENLFKIL